jgi:hypothetical protein
MYELKIISHLDDLDKMIVNYPDASTAARTARVTEALQVLESIIKQITPEGAGPIHIRDTMFGRTLMQGNLVYGQFGTPAIYGESLEYGTVAHFPPVEPIQFWVEKVLGITGSEAKGVAFCIARAISRRGTPGAHMFEKGIAYSEPYIMTILNQIPEDIVRRLSS